MGEPERRHYNITLGILAFAGLAFALQQTMIVPALSSLQRDLHTTTAWAAWFLTAFLLVMAVSTHIPAESAFVIAFWASAGVALLGAVLALRTNEGRARGAFAN